MPCPHNMEKPIDFWLRKGKAVGGDRADRERMPLCEGELSAARTLL